MYNSKGNHYDLKKSNKIGFIFHFYENVSYFSLYYLFNRHKKSRMGNFIFPDPFYSL
jgi:hypothetical protein